MFIDGALPGERVRYELVKSRPRYEIGRIAAVLRPSVDRVVPRCAHFGFFQGALRGLFPAALECDGSARHQATRTGKCIVACGEGAPLQYFATYQWTHLGLPPSCTVICSLCATQRRLLGGFHERATSFVADIQSCAVLPARISDLLMPLRQLIAGLSIRDRLPQIEVAVGTQTRRTGGSCTRCTNCG